MEQTTKRNDLFWKVLSVLLFVALIGTVAVMLWQNQRGPIVRYEATPGAKPKLASYDPGFTNSSNVYWIADLAEKSLPFVVNIKTSMTPKKADKTQSDAERQRMLEALPPEFRNLMPNPDDNSQNWNLPENHPAVTGEGSGFVYREDGYIVTNAHVVGDADKFTVKLSDGKEYEAKLIGTDDMKDIGVLKIDKGGLPVAPLGDSDTVRVGEPVIAIGSPLGYESTVTAGIISTNHRSLKELSGEDDPRSTQSYLQTDAAINQGNSGGPLLNAHGEVIGVNRAIVRQEYSIVGGMGQMVPIEGIGFAIPINDIKNTIDQIVKHGKVVYPGIQAKIAGVEEYLKLNPNLKLDVDKGVYVVSVTVGGPAERAGIKAGDVILTINGTAVNSGKELIEDIQQYKVGDRVTLRVAREGSKRQEDMTVVLGELDLNGMNQDE